MNPFRIAGGIVSAGIWIYGAMHVSRPWDIVLGGIAGLCLALGFKESKSLDKPNDTQG